MKHPAQLALAFAAWAFALSAAAQEPAPTSSGQGIPAGSSLAVNASLKFAWEVPARGEWDLVLGAWLPRFEGTLRWGGTGTEFEASDLDLDDLEATFAGDLSWRNEWVRATIGGFDFSTSGAAILPAGSAVGGTTLNVATAADTAASMWSVSGQVAVSLWRPFAPQTALWNEPVASPRGIGPRGSSVDLSFEALLALRYLALEQSLTTASGRVAFDQTAFCVGIGGGMRFRWLPAEVFPPIHGLDVVASAAVGPALLGGGSFVQVEAALEWEVCRNFAARFGYRLLDWTLESDGDRSVAGLQGLFVGGRISF